MTKIYERNANNFIEKDYIKNVNFYDNINGNNILIYESDVKLYNCKIYWGNNNVIYISKSKYKISGLDIRLTNCNGGVVYIGSDFSSRGVRLLCLNGASIIIGSDCMFATDIKLCTTDSHAIINAENCCLNYDEDIIIGNHVWIAEEVRILRGSIISDNSIIGLRSLVNKKFLMSSVLIAGIPATVKKMNVFWVRDKPFTGKKNLYSITNYDNIFTKIFDASKLLIKSKMYLFAINCLDFLYRNSPSSNVLQYLIDCYIEIRNFSIAKSLCKNGICIFSEHIYYFKLSKICFVENQFFDAFVYLNIYINFEDSFDDNVFYFFTQIVTNMKLIDSKNDLLNFICTTYSNSHNFLFLIAKFFYGKNDFVNASKVLSDYLLNNKLLNNNLFLPSLKLYVDMLCKYNSFSKALSFLNNIDVDNNHELFLEILLLKAAVMAKTESFNDALSLLDEYFKFNININSLIMAFQFSVRCNEVKRAFLYLDKIKIKDYSVYKNTLHKNFDKLFNNYNSMYEYITRNNNLLSDIRFMKIFIICISNLKILDKHFNIVNDFLNRLKYPVNRYYNNYINNHLFDKKLPDYSYCTDLDISMKSKNYNVYVLKNKRTSITFYNDDKIAIIVAVGISQSIIDYTQFELPINSYFFIHVPFHFDKTKLESQIKFWLDCTKSKFSLDKIFLMCNTNDELLIAKDCGLINSFFCNQNCWIDYNLFKIISCKKEYDLVLNCRPEKKSKRPFLANKVQNLAIIKGNLVRNNDYFDLNTLKPSFINDNYRLSIVEVVSILNKSYCGGIFSPVEGACYSSSEFLLCGLPVISTKSLGGRDYWYDNDNSIIVDPDEYNVYRAVELAKYRLTSGIFSPFNIRKRHIAMSNKLREVFVDRLRYIFSINSLNIDCDMLLKSKYIHQLKNFRAHKHPTF